MEETTRYLLIGGGVCSVWAAQNIRERDSEGRIILVSADHYPPYDRPPLSKQFLLSDDFSLDDASSKFDHFYPENRIELRLKTRATGIDRANRVVTLDSGDRIRYEKLLLATGSDARKLNLPGSELEGIFYLRMAGDAEAIRQAIRVSRRAVIVGAGYIGMEVAAVCAQRGVETTVIERLAYPWAQFASPTIGNFLRQYYEGQGVQFLFGEEVASFEGSGGRLTGVRTRSGKVIPADFCVVGVGAVLRTQLAADAGLEIDPRHGVKVNAFLQTSDPNIWAAGDIACFEDLVSEKPWHLEHHLNAKWQGRAVGAIMAGEQKPYNQVPYFFSDVFDIHMCLRGDPEAATQTKVLGDLTAGEFVEVGYDDTGRLRVGIGISHEEPKLDPISDNLEALIREKAKIEGLTAATFGL